MNPYYAIMFAFEPEFQYSGKNYSLLPRSFTELNVVGRDMHNCVHSFRNVM